MDQISEQEFREAIIATKKDAKLIAAAKNDRTNSPAALYAEFTKLPLERRRDIIISICNDHFTASQWKIAFPLNNFPADVLPSAVAATGRALFFAREEASIREVVRAVKIYQNSPFCKQIAELLGHGAEVVGHYVARVAEIVTTAEIYGMVKSLDPGASNSVRIVSTVVTTAIYCKDFRVTLMVGKFLHARRHSAILNDLAVVLESSIFLARDRKSVQEILAGFTAGSIDVVLQKAGESKGVLSAIRDVAWKTKNAGAIRQYLSSLLR